jgi:hypothetical protein
MIQLFILLSVMPATHSTDCYSDTVSQWVMSLFLSFCLFQYKNPQCLSRRTFYGEIRLAKKSSRRWQGNANRIFLHSVWGWQYVISTPLLTALVWSVDGGVSLPSRVWPLFSPSLLVSVCVLFQHQIIIGHLMERKRDTDRTVQAASCPGMEG